GADSPAMPSPESRKGLAAEQLLAPFSLSDVAGLGEPAAQSRGGARGRGVSRQLVDGLIDRVQPQSESRARRRTRERALKVRVGLQLSLPEGLRLSDEILQHRDGAC